MFIFLHSVDKNLPEKNSKPSKKFGLVGGPAQTNLGRSFTGIGISGIPGMSGMSGMSSMGKSFSRTLGFDASHILPANGNILEERVPKNNILEEENILEEQKEDDEYFSVEPSQKNQNSEVQEPVKKETSKEVSSKSSKNSKESEKKNPPLATPLTMLEQSSINADEPGEAVKNIIAFSEDKTQRTFLELQARGEKMLRTLTKGSFANRMEQKKTAEEILNEISLMISYVFEGISDKIEANNAKAGKFYWDGTAFTLKKPEGSALTLLVFTENRRAISENVKLLSDAIRCFCNTTKNVNRHYEDIHKIIRNFLAKINQVKSFYDSLQQSLERRRILQDQSFAEHINDLTPELNFNQDSKSQKSQESQNLSSKEGKDLRAKVQALTEENAKLKNLTDNIIIKNLTEENTRLKNGLQKRDETNAQTNIQKEINALKLALQELQQKITTEKSEKEQTDKQKEGLTRQIEDLTLRYDESGWERPLPKSRSIPTSSTKNNRRVEHPQTTKKEELPNVLHREATDTGKTIINPNYRIIFVKTRRSYEPVISRCFSSKFDRDKYEIALHTINYGVTNNYGRKANGQKIIDKAYIIQILKAYLEESDLSFQGDFNRTGIGDELAHNLDVTLVGNNAEDDVLFRRESIKLEFTWEQMYNKDLIEIARQKAREERLAKNQGKNLEKNTKEKECDYRELQFVKLLEQDSAVFPDYSRRIKK